MSEEAKATIYTDRREFLLAAVRDKRDAFVGSIQVGEDPENIVCHYGLARTEHQFRLALCDHLFPAVVKLSNREVQKQMADEFEVLAKGAK